MKPPDEDHNDDELRPLLRSIERDAAAPDRAFLDQLRDRSAAAFAAGPVAPSTTPAKKGRTMTGRLLGFLAATAAAAAIVYFGFFHSSKPVEKLALGKVLEEVSNAKSVHVKVTRGGQTGEAWAEKRGRYRQDLGDGAYRIADGDMFWSVNEKTGKSERVKNEKPPSDLFGILLAGHEHGKIDAVKAEPADSVTRDGVEYLVYHISVEAPQNNIDIEALVRADNKRLYLLQAKGKRDGKPAVLAELQLVSMNEPLPEEKFAILNSLSEDGRVGKVADVQGVVTVKPLNAERWAPANGNLVLMPGDYVRTDNRGANAVAMRLLSKAVLTAGPGSLVEIPKSTQVRLHEGELEINAPKGQSVELIGPDDQKTVVKGTQFYRVDRNQKLRLVEQLPLWLKGFKGATANESLGSLIAKVDGRNVPLSVGYHKVTVDIRDQIARTVVEESFVNHTESTLEGVFHFPLPQDASIAGFGMWIGNELVDADVVEKQRAREIYEQIKRERRDPGLLEWSGGNIFTARVWPIFAHSEKRIKITYTQVLPLRGSSYRYSYALQSELLQQHPLRDLSISVHVHSNTALKKVTSLTHSTRDQLTKHSARVEFTAQEYTPQRDFELIVEQDKAAGDIAMIPHRRGEDGYFLLQVMPPYQDVAAVQTGSVQMLILADTSASMDRGQRHKQDAFIATMLAMLTPNDTFNLGTCDVTTDWAFPNAVAATPKNIEHARQTLEKRVSLGWTDLDKAFSSALAMANDKSHVVYVGDGITTTGDADPVAFAKRLKLAYAGNKGTFHAVTVGNSYESGVLNAIASLGGGSTRRVAGDRTPGHVAAELMREIAQPVLRDVKVEFTGLRVARVYPEQLPNLPVGTQQIILGRYLPENRDQSGEVTVTGTLAGKPIRMSAKLALKDAESGNSFIPRLWARMHLDALLEQGTSEAIRDEIIALSEEFSIMTPYTSFLVLESDADRERFGVKRRFRMRDGEKFFAEGRDNVQFQLVQQQMKRAGLWRLNLRRDVLRSLSGLGRFTRAMQPERFRTLRQKDTVEELRSLEEFDINGPGASMDMPMSTSMPGLGIGWSADGAELSAGRNTTEGIWKEKAESGFEFDERESLGKLIDDDKEKKLSIDRRQMAYEDVTREIDGLDIANRGNWTGGRGFRDAEEWNEFAPQPGKPMGGPVAAGESIYGGFGYGVGGGKSRIADYEYLGYFGRPMRPRYDDSIYWRQQWWQMVFPALPRPAKPQAAKRGNWSNEIRQLAESLRRSDMLRQMQGGLEIAGTAETFDHRWQELTSRSRFVRLYEPKRWLDLSAYDQGPTTVNWCDGKERGVLNRAFQIGRIRAMVPEDLNFEVNFEEFSLDSYHTGFDAKLEKIGKDRVRLTITPSHDARYETRYTIDTARKVVLALEYFNEGKLQSAARYDDFVEVGGLWWHTKHESVNDKGVVTSRTTRSVKLLTMDGLTKRLNEELAGKESAFVTRFPLPRLTAAKTAVSEKKATLEDRAKLLTHFAAVQQWEKVKEQLVEIEKLAGKTGGYRWLNDAVLHLSRCNEELRLRQLEEAEKLTKAKVDANDRWAVAMHLTGKAPNFMQAAEILALVDKLQLVAEGQPKHIHTGKTLDQIRVSYLPSIGRQHESLALLKKLATDYPRDEGLQRQYAQTLANNRDFPAAYEWIKQAIARNDRWEEWEIENLRNLHVSLLQQQGNYPEMLVVLTDWMKKKPANSSSYAMYLSTLVRLDQETKANELAAQWLKDAQKAGALSGEVTARLNAAIYYAIGQGYNLYTYRVEERWLKPLAEVVRYFARSDKYGNYADIPMQHGQFVNTDEARKIRSDVAGWLIAEAGTLNPYRLQRFIQWQAQNDPALPAATWQKIAEKLLARWNAETKAGPKTQVAQALIQVLRERRPVEELLAFLRTRLKDAKDDAKPQAALELFNTLLQQPYQPEFENELFALLPALVHGDDAGHKLAVQVEALHRLTDRMVPARAEALNKKIDRPDKLTRTELRDKQTANLKLAREGYADRLVKELATAPAEMRPWLKAERIFLDVRLERNSAQVAADCWEMLSDEPPKPIDAEKEFTITDQLDRVLKDRALTTLFWLAAKPKADPRLVEKLIQFIDKGVAREGESNAWKSLKQRVLIALDRPKDLEKNLREWIKSGDGANIWRLALGFLVAEQGKLAEAVQLFEAIETADELGPLGYRSLAGWYQVLNKREQHDRATIASYKTVDEYRLSRMLYTKLQPWQRGDSHLPSELDKEVLFIFTALFEKSAHPQNYLSQMQQFYQACRDFRLLGTLADSVVGQTAGRIYPFLGGMGQVFYEIREEATVDEMMAHLANVRGKAKTPIDHRALDLMEALVRGRAAELQNQPAPHGDKALIALRRAFDRQWVQDEQPLMAHLLASLGKIAYKPLADEQVRELEELHRLQKPGTYHRLAVGHNLGTIYYSYGPSDKAVDVLFDGLKEYSAANQGVLPVDANGVITTLISYLQSGGKYQRGETFLLDELKHPVHEQQKLWLTHRLFEHYHAALSNNGEVSLGKGAVLYKSFEQKLRIAADSPDAQHHYAMLGLLTRVYRTAHSQKISGFADDLRNFAFKLLPELLKKHPTYYDSIVQTTSSTVHDLLGAKEGIAFLLDRIENEPTWLRLNNQDGWSRYGYSLAHWRTEVKDLGDLEPRLLKVVLAELRRDLESRQARNRNIYARGHNYYWQEKESEFVKVAEEVYSKRKDSGASVKYIAEYFYYGVNRPNRAIEILYAALERKLLDEEGRLHLISYLQSTKRYAEAITLLIPLIEERPEVLDYRTRLMTCYHATKQKEKLIATLKAADAFFHQKDRWQQNVIAALAHACLNTDLYQEAAAYYTEVIPLHQRSAPRRGVGDGTLSEYYANLGRAYSRLGKTAEAVEAVSGAVVAWPRDNHNRSRYLQRLQEVMMESANLDGYVQELDRKEAADGQGSPVLRKALGKAYQAKQQFAKALAQFRVAAELQPEDAQTHQEMVACYDRLRDKEGAVRQLYEAVQVSRRNILLYEQMGVRYEEMKRPADAERAFTSIVEMQANEFESHAKLAQVRQRQNRWEEAAAHWQRVAQLQRLEPTGLLELAKAQMHMGQWDKASDTVRQLEKKSWPARFSNVREEIAGLRVKIEQRRKRQ